ncbi:MAG: hypothetical protein B7Z36_02135 [Novosphingobium sp. 12-63-9]|nr:MAG: hypothetical protein B7Z36_02135 [Novosphingobium sp. 12-63-9]
MTIMYRFTTAHRSGKWYGDLETAQRQAGSIGAGFYEQRSGAFYQYPGTRLETQAVDDDDGMMGRELAA